MGRLPPSARTARPSKNAARRRHKWSPSPRDLLNDGPRYAATQIANLGRGECVERLMIIRGDRGGLRVKETCSWVHPADGWAAREMRGLWWASLSRNQSADLSFYGRETTCLWAPATALVMGP